ncbi:MAG: hypothetical protein LAT64_06885 [Phycisphaerales bacterium]|nr:hypothetical protein [Planctomycetota bacterium]MCH8508479.1 hypothetical protein [Phycisphaerales bacterium]
MALKPPPLAVGIVLIIIGLIAAVVLSIAALQLVGDHHARAVNITVPDTVTIELDPDIPHAIDRELAGPHITANRPLLDPPDDLEIRVFDADTGDPIETTPWNWWSSQQFFGLTRERQALARFDAPAHGRVRIEITGDFAHEQVFAVSPTYERYQKRYQTPLQILIAGAILIFLAGLACCIARIAAAAPPLDRPETPD